MNIINYKPLLRSILVFTMLFITNSGKSSIHNKTIIRGKEIELNVYYKDAVATDTLYLLMSDVINLPIDRDKNTYWGVMNEDGHFQFKIPVVADFGYFELKKSRTFTKQGKHDDTMFLLTPQYWEAGDKVTIKLNHKESMAGIFSECSFEGAGSDKYTARHLIEKNRDSGAASSENGFDGNPFKAIAIYKLSNSEENQIKILDSFQDRITSKAYDLLKADIHFLYNPGFNRIKNFVRDSISINDVYKKVQFKKEFSKVLLQENYYGIPPESLSNSRSYLEFILAGYNYYSQNEGIYEPDTVFNLIKQTSFVPIKEALFLLFFKGRSSININLQLIEAERIIQTQGYKIAIKKMQESANGQRFLSYSLKDQNGNDVRISDFKGKIILIDIWFNGCGYCMSYFKNVLSTVEARYNNSSEIVFISISSDISKIRWQNGIASGNYTSEKVINLNTNGLGDKHPLISENGIFGAPFAILLNKEGRIVEYNSTSLYKYTTLVDSIENLLSIKPKD